MASTRPIETPVLNRIEQVLTELTQYINNPGDHSDVRGERQQDVEPVATDAAARRMTLAIGWDRARVARDKAFGPDLFTDPAWCMLLDLYLGRGKRQAVSLSSLSIAANVPLTTGVRWVTLLEKAGLVRRAPDPFDGRRTLVFLTDHAIERMHVALDATAESNRQLGIEHVVRAK